MTVLALTFEQERETIDKYRTRTNDTSPAVTHTDTPGENPNGFGGDKAYRLPDPAVGGENASGEQNGYSTGFVSFFTRTQRFRGAVATPPPVRNPVQGNVGMNNRQAALYAGVMNQGSVYNPSQMQYNAAWVESNGV